MNHVKAGWLIIVPCGQVKIWKREPDAGPTWACDAYVGSPFKVNRRYAERFAEKWVILSAKYGFVAPDFKIPGQYNVTFKKQSTDPISVKRLREQVTAARLDRFSTIVALGGKDYQKAVMEAFAGVQVQPQFPFAGLRIGDAMHATNQAVKTGRPFPAKRTGR